MSRKLTPQSSLDGLKKEAKRWLKALRANDATAHARLYGIYPNARTVPGLRDVQHALALEHGLTGWAALKASLAESESLTDDRSDLVDWFLENACPDHHVRGRPDHAMALHTAERILKRYSVIARDSIYTAVVCGDIDEVERILAKRPQAAVEKRSGSTAERDGGGGSGDRFTKALGPKGWEPLLFLCFTRLLLPAANDNAVTIARMLLDHGADPNAFFMAGSSRYTPLVGVIGEGEEDRPPHPHRDELVRLLLDWGAELYDIQVVYNIHFHGDVLWFLKLIHEHSVKMGRKADWDDPEWSMLNMGGYGSGARWHLDIALSNNDLELADWVLSHGANPDSTPARDPRFSQRTPHEEAVRQGSTDLADLLVRFGATPSSSVITGEEQFAAACLRLDRAEARTLADAHPEYLMSPAPMMVAAARDRADVVELLLDLGMSPDIPDPTEGNHHALHAAAYSNALRVAALLIERGAEVDARESKWGNTPLGAAAYYQHRPMIEYLSRYSRDIWELTFTGNVDRVREVLRAEPELARVVSDGWTPLMWMYPEDEARALELVELFLANGADASHRNKDGHTAADLAEKNGMFEVAEALRNAAPESPAPAPDTTPITGPSMEEYEQLAKDIAAAYRSGDADALQRIRDHTRSNASLDLLRSGVRQALGLDPESRTFEVSPDDAQLLVARFHGFESWHALVEHFESVPAGRVTATPVKLFTVDEQGAEVSAGGARDWDEVIGVMNDQRIPGLNADGQMTDEVLERISQLEFVTSLKLDGSTQVTDAGLRHLARLPGLRHLHLSGTRITDRGLEVLRDLPELRTLTLHHHSAITDVGAANLAHCQNIEHVSLMGTPAGDGAIRALAGKSRLRHFQAGNFVTDAGLAVFQEFPVFKTWQGGEVAMSLLSPDADPNFLWLNLKAPFTNQGLANLAGLDGLFALSLFGGRGVMGFDSRSSAVTPAGLGQLAELPNLAWLGCTNELCSDEAMSIIADMPRLRFLMCQDTVAGDEGFVALSRSQTIEYTWGRRCHNLKARGFAALARMAALRSLSVNCKNVSDEGLSALPRFPELTELMPMGIRDDDFRHIGRCEKLESLIGMYCGPWTDTATGHLAGLTRLKSYSASSARITDRSLELLGKITSLERLSFDACPAITNSGLASLARLPQLQEIRLSGVPKITREGTAVFPTSVRVEYSP